ncbi:fibronectin type III domain-containing protein [Variovorax sp. J22R133]|uniref:extracellular catalytic domain type 2 short-chain-length polyhydroxyalkanoate depolymerase n=1 Tax=Variovorax brevis TaxID=3053503 RepID=UPI0025776A15|nr:fibronectin type III domain-containing protein [Variovorax sp. J22R133]MDM0110782.1 fibronectin type III domain-containing protein [Variovorax sp. J22R133]
MRKLVLAAVAAMLLPAFPARSAVPLPKLNIDTTATTVSGLSSGGFMANQLGYAYSSTFRGVGVFAAGPYMCAGHSNYTACMYNASISTQMLNTMQADINNWSGTAIDNKTNVAQQKVYLFVGNSDTTVGPNPMNAVQTQYTANGVTAANMEYVKRAGAAHTFPTDFDATGNNGCGSASSPYISNCSYDGAKAVLTKLYGPLNARNDAPGAANYIEFDQTAFTSNPGMAPTGWVYVPAACANGTTACRVHVALHGCQQNYATVGDRFIKNTGYSRWADTNRIVVLFPQTRVDNTSRPTSASGSLANPNGCWDWIGWYGSNFAQRAGSQQVAIKAMVDQLSSGSGGGGGGGGGGALPAPTGVTLSAATSSSMTIGWSAVAAAQGYNVYRNGSKSNTSPVAGTSYTDTGLAAATQYSWTVAAVDGSGLEGAMSAPATGTTSGGEAAVCYTASNYAHVSAGRAHMIFGYAYANGSNQNMGLWNVFFTTTLKRTGADYYVIGSCP